MERKIIAVVLAVLLSFSLCVPAYATASPSPSPTASPTGGGGHSSGGGAGARWTWIERFNAGLSDFWTSIFSGDDPEAAYQSAVAELPFSEYGSDGYYYTLPIGSTDPDNSYLNFVVSGNCVTINYVGNYAYSGWGQQVFAPDFTLSVLGVYEYAPIIISNTGVHRSGGLAGREVVNSVTSFVGRNYVAVFENDSNYTASYIRVIPFRWCVTPYDPNFSGSEKYTSSTRIGSINGDIYSTNEDSSLTVYENCKFVDEENHLFFLPSTNTLVPYTGFTYDYSNFTYNFTTDSGNTSITYGDEYITQSVTDNSVTNIYNYYYSTGSGGSSSGDGTVPSSGWDWLKNLFGDGFSGLLSGLGSGLKKIIEALADLIARFIAAIGDLFANIADVFMEIVGWLADILESIFAAVSDGFASFFSFIWQDAYTGFSSA